MEKKLTSQLFKEWGYDPYEGLSEDSPLRKLDVDEHSGIFSIRVGCKLIRDALKLINNEQESLEYGGKTYRIVKIGSQIWIAENLDYAGPNGGIGRYYEDDHANGEKYGRLYTWEEAMNVCPPGWHLPSREEWKTLVDCRIRRYTIFFQKSDFFPKKNVYLLSNNLFNVEQINQ